MNRVANKAMYVSKLFYMIYCKVRGLSFAQRFEEGKSNLDLHARNYWQHFWSGRIASPIASREGAMKAAGQ